MPIDIDPDKTFSLILQDDATKPESEQRTLIFRHLSAREEAKMDDIFARSKDSGVLADIVAKAREGISIALVGWKNFKDEAGADVPFEISSLNKILTRGETIEVRDILPMEMTLGFLKRSRSASQSPSTSDESAKPTVTDAA